MAEENFFDMLNRVNNPHYYYGRKKNEEKKTEKEKTKNKKKTGHPKSIKQYPVFKVQD